MCDECEGEICECVMSVLVQVSGRSIAGSLQGVDSLHTFGFSLAKQDVDSNMYNGQCRQNRLQLTDTAPHVPSSCASTLSLSLSPSRSGHWSL